MFDPDEMAARQAALAQHMAGRLNMLAERVFAQAEAASDPQGLQAAALTVERLYRGVRLSMAFEARVVREHRRRARETQAETQAADQQARAVRVKRLRQAVGRTFIADYEAERDAAEDPDEDLRSLSGYLAAVSEAITGAEAEITAAGDFDAEVAELREAARLIARMNALAREGRPPPPAPPQTAAPQTARPLMWRPSG